jgi:hypothetical protein
MVRGIFADLGCHEPQAVDLAIERIEDLSCPLLSPLPGEVAVACDRHQAAEHHSHRLAFSASPLDCRGSRVQRQIHPPGGTGLPG